MRRAAAALVVLLSGACALPPAPEGLNQDIAEQLAKTGERKAPARPESLERALLPPVQLGMPSAPGLEPEQRFDLAVTNAPAAQVFMSIVSGTRYSMLVHPEVAGSISVNLKDVTVEEALSAIRELYGYDYRLEGTRIYMQPVGLQTRVFQVNYLPGLRRGMSDLRVQSGGADMPSSGATIGGTQTGTASGGSGTTVIESSRVTMQQQTDFWSDLRTAIVTIVGSADGRSVVVSPHSGVVVVRAFPQQLRSVEQYLRATKLAVERQVMIEAKIIDVELSEAYQAGINWALFRNSGPDFVAGQLPTARPTTLGTRGQTISSGGLTVDGAGRTIAGVPDAATAAAAGAAGGIFGLALQTSNFAALLAFLETQGNVQVLSSPRVATLNTQKAVLKVGRDEIFVANIEPGSAVATGAGAAQQTPTPRLAPFFSGIVLDVTPQIDDANNIILHIHPAISDVTEKTRAIPFGISGEPVNFPLASRAVNETDTIVRVNDGNIVAIGGLMSVDVRDERSGIPGVSDTGILGALLRNANRTSRKRELVILLKPTLIQSERNWEQDLGESRGRFDALNAPRKGK
jgi:MSHA biogenesis protein MshL